MLTTQNNWYMVSVGANKVHLCVVHGVQIHHEASGLDARLNENTVHVGEAEEELNRRSRTESPHAPGGGSSLAGVSQHGTTALLNNG